MRLDSAMGEARRTTGRLGFYLGVIALAATASGQVTLQNSVMKVERFINGDGHVESRLVPADEVVPGDELHYTIEFANNGKQTVDENSIVITNPVPEQTEYIDGSATGEATEVVFSVDEGRQFADADILTIASAEGDVPASARDYTTIRWKFSPSLEPGQRSHVAFNVRLK